MAGLVGKDPIDLVRDEVKRNLAEYKNNNRNKIAGLDQADNLRSFVTFADGTVIRVQVSQVVGPR